MAPPQSEEESSSERQIVQHIFGFVVEGRLFGGNQRGVSVKLLGEMPCSSCAEDGIVVGFLYCVNRWSQRNMLSWNAGLTHIKYNGATIKQASR